MLGRGSVMFTCAALVLTGQVGDLGGVAAPSRDGCTGDPSSAAPLRYVVLFDRGTSAGAATSEIEAACGATAGYYPKIAVAIATAPGPDFAERFGSHRVFSAQSERLAAHRTGSAAPGGERPEHSSSVAVPQRDRTAEQWDMRAVGADLVRDVNPGSEDVVVGVLDAGIDATHPDLAGAVDARLSAGCLSGVANPARSAWLPTTSPHGTHVAGLIAAADDGAGISGVAPGVRVASVKVVDDRGFVDPEAAVCGLMWAARHDMDVANSSYFVAPWSPACTPTEGAEVVREAITRAVEYASEVGTLNVAAATNGGVNLTPSPGSGEWGAAETGTCEALPAGVRETVAVSSVGPGRVKARYSSYGLGVVDVTAPGGSAGRCVLSTVPGGYAERCGTSMAAPHVSGVAALLVSERPDLSPRELRTALGEQATPLPCPTDYDLAGDGTQDAYCAGYTSYNGFYGHGLVNAPAAAGEPVLPEEQPGEPAGRGDQSERAQRQEVRDVPEHRGIEHAYR